MAHSLRDPVHCGGKVWQQRRETDAHLMSAVRKQRDDACTQFTSSSSFTPDPQAHDMTPPQLVGLSEFSLETHRHSQRLGS